MKTGGEEKVPFEKSPLAFEDVEKVGHEGDYLAGPVPTRGGARAGLDPTQVRRYLTFMETIVSSKGQIVLPSPLRKRDNIRAGQRFSVERLRSGDYRLVRQQAPGDDLVAWLRSCPEKDYFKAPHFSDTTDDVLK